MPKPGLEFEQGHQLFGVEQLGGDGGSCSMAGDAAASILEQHARFAAQEWSQRSIEVLRWNRLTAETEEHRNGLTGLSIEEVRLHWTLPLPCVHSVTDQRIDRLCEGRSGLIRRHVEQASGSVTGHVLWSQRLGSHYLVATGCIRHAAARVHRCGVRQRARSVPAPALAQSDTSAWRAPVA